MLVKKLQDQMTADQVSLIVCPPHLISKWQREILSIQPKAFITQLKRHEDIHDFMEKASLLGEGIPKIGLIKRDMTKLGSGQETAVLWHKVAKARWAKTVPVPLGYEAKDRIYFEEKPYCPHCGQVVMRNSSDGPVLASAEWLKGKRVCSSCQSPLWQDIRDSGARPKEGEKFASKNPRYRLDHYLKRRYPGRVFLLIWDEIHEAANADTGNGEAFGRMANCAQKVLALTGTPFNGRSSSLFNLQYHLNPRVRQRYPWGGAERLSRKMRGSQAFQSLLEGAAEAGKQQRGRAESLWVEDMGVLEQVVEERPEYHRETGAYTGTTTYQRPYQEAPGISPLLVAEIMDHTVFFSLKDLGKALPDYREIAYPVELDADVAACYEETKSFLKDYLNKRRWEGDSSFKGAYLQWSMGWPNATFRPMEIIHNLRDGFSRRVQPHTVKSLPSFGEERIFAKEQALLDLLKEKLAAGRPCVVFLRQTASRDIQPRIEKLIREHVPEAKPFILKNSVDAERREKVIEAEIRKGMNVLISNPELVKTGLDLIAFPTLIFYEMVFNLGTMMQAAARSYRLNQEAKVCETYYMYATGTMEETAAHLMSRKQRAAKLLTGDIGLSGLDALTESEGSFEEALLDAIASEDSLLDPRDLFQQSQENLEEESDDMAYWNVRMDEAEEYIPEILPVEAPLFRFAEAQDKLSHSSAGGQPLREESPKQQERQASQKSKGFGFVWDESVLPESSATSSMKLDQASPSSPKSKIAFAFSWEENEAAAFECLTMNLLSLKAATEPATKNAENQKQRLSNAVLNIIRQVSAWDESKQQQVSLKIAEILLQGIRDEASQVLKLMGLSEAAFMRESAVQKRMATFLNQWLKAKGIFSPISPEQSIGAALVSEALKLTSPIPMYPEKAVQNAETRSKNTVAQRKGKAKSKQDLLRLPTAEAAIQMAMF